MTLFDQLHAIARQRGGKLLSTSCANRHEVLLWECAKGHQWQATGHSIKSGNSGKGCWCPECRKGGRPSDKTIEDVQVLVEERGGQVIAGEYHNNTSKISVRCAAGHDFVTDLLHLQAGKWCPHCSSRRKLTYEIVAAAAAEAGLELLATKEQFAKHAVPVRCKKCGDERTINAYRVMEKRGCRSCQAKAGWEKRQGA